jgi:hypothetical protein
MVFYAYPIFCGINNVSSLGDGYSINVSWYKAYPTVYTNKIAYNIYYSTNKEDVYSEGIKYISIDDSIEANIIDLSPGQLYFFSVRPVEYNPLIFNLNLLPTAYDNLKIAPNSLLRSDISSTDTIIPLLDVMDFPPSGVVKIGSELIKYVSINQIINNLNVPGSQTTDGYIIYQIDGYYQSASTNIGDGYLIGLTLVNTNIQTETWNVKCVFVQEIGGSPVPNTAKFILEGSISGVSRDGYLNPIIWTANGIIISNGIFSFRITETVTFRKNDYFIIKVQGSKFEEGGRGYGNTRATLHTVDGYDGYYYQDPFVNFWTMGEDNSFDRIYLCQNRFEYPHFQATITDGYHQVVKDLLTTDLSESDEYNTDFPPYDYSGYHRTDPVQLLTGQCVGSYIGGEYGCIDKYGNVNILRGMSLQDQNNQRQEVLLSVTGRPAVLIKRVRTGITCSCYLPSSQYQDDRCPMCYGTKFVLGYEQFFNPRRSDGRILVRCGPADEDLKVYEGGLESEFTLDFWALTVPTIKDRDIIILFDQNDIEEYRYEVLTVTRNNTITGLQGGQKFKAQRIRKTDPAYQIRVFRNTSEFPSNIDTTIGMVPGLILPHKHVIVISEKITSITQINQMTSVVQGHNHEVVLGVVRSSINHDHTLILP